LGPQRDTARSVNGIEFEQIAAGTGKATVPEKLEIDGMEPSTVVRGARARQRSKFGLKQEIVFLTLQLSEC